MILKSIKEYVSKRKAELKEKVSQMSAVPTLAIIQVGSVEASNRYIRNKIKDCEEVGITAHWYAYGEEITEDELKTEIKDLQNHYHGIIIQLPLPEHLRPEVLIEAISPEKDVDGFGPLAPYKPATAKGIVDYLDYCEWDACGKNVVIIGRSEIVGKPLAQMMTDKDATVTLCHSKTKKLYQHIEIADLVVSAVGKPMFLNCYPIHVPVIDVGINFIDGKMCGDCFNTENRDVSPVPGGVGLLTRLALLDNVIEAYEKQ